MAASDTRTTVIHNKFATLLQTRSSLGKRQRGGATIVCDYLNYCRCFSHSSATHIYLQMSGLTNLGTTKSSMNWCRHCSVNSSLPSAFRVAQGSNPKRSIDAVRNLIINWINAPVCLLNLSSKLLDLVHNVPGTILSQQMNNFPRHLGKAPL